MNNKSTTQNKKTHGLVLPIDGFSRYASFRHLICIGRTKWHQLTKAGKAPPPIVLGSRTTVYSNKELHRFMSNPAGYSVGGE